MPFSFLGKNKSKRKLETIPLCASRKFLMTASENTNTCRRSTCLLHSACVSSVERTKPRENAVLKITISIMWKFFSVNFDNFMNRMLCQSVMENESWWRKCINETETYFSYRIQLRAGCDASFRFSLIDCLLITREPSSQFYLGLLRI